MKNDSFSCVENVLTLYAKIGAGPTALIYELVLIFYKYFTSTVAFSQSISHGRGLA